MKLDDFGVGDYILYKAKTLTFLSFVGEIYENGALFKDVWCCTYDYSQTTRHFSEQHLELFELLKIYKELPKEFLI